MTAPALNPPIVSPLIVGRSPQLAVLEKFLQQVMNGSGHVLLISAEAGIGKSRLTAEAKSWAAEHGLTILQGTCFAADQALPYAPLLELLSSFVSAHKVRPGDLAAAFADPAARAVVRLLPELAAWIPEGDRAGEAATDQEQDRRLLFQALLSFFATVAASHALLVVLEDLHWSDDASLEFVHQLARRVATQPICLLLTYRGDESHGALDGLLAALDRERLAAEMPLQRLSLADVDAMVRAIFQLDRPVRGDFLDSLYTLTEGNPFFVEEVLRSLIASGDIFFSDGTWDRKPLGQLRVPRTVEDAVRRRLAALPAAARAVLEVAAVAGRRFDFELLQTLTERTESELVESMKELIAAGLVVEETADQFAFKHPLTRQAVHDGLLARERRTLHRRIADALEQRSEAHTIADEHVTPLAYHFFEAGVWTKALEYGRRAGKRAEALYAPQAVIAHLTRALEAAIQLRLPMLESVPLLRARARAKETLGDFEPAREDYEATLEIARASHAALAEWQALIDLGGLWSGREYVRGGAYFQAALERARSLDDPGALARSLNWLGNWHVNADESDRAVKLHLEALSILRDLNDRQGIAQTLDHLGMSETMRGDALKGHDYFRQALALLRELDDRRGLVTSLTVYSQRGGGNMGDLFELPPTMLVEARESCKEALAIARDIGWRSGEAFALNFLSYSLGASGAFATSIEASNAALTLAQQIEHREWTIQAHWGLSVSYLELYALPLARTHAQRALDLTRELESVFWVRFTSLQAARVCIAQGAHAEAEALLDAAFDAGRRPRTWVQYGIGWARAELALACANSAAAVRILDELESDAEHRAGVRLMATRGESMARLGRLPEARTVLERARGIADAQGAAPLIYRIDAELGRVSLAERRPDDAARWFASAHAVIDRLASEIPDKGLRSTFVQGATRGMPEPRADSLRRSAREEFGGLTPREREVARRVAYGNSNLEIADALVVAERTVETHVSNIMGKLSVHSRAQIAAWAVTKGLLTRVER